MTILIDFRPNNKTGIYRHGMEIIPRLLKKSDEKFIIFCPAYIQQTLCMKIGDWMAHNTQFVISENFGFIRKSFLIKEAIRRYNVKLVYSINYLLETDLDVPFIFTIHDVLRLKNPNFCYSNKEFIAKNGSLELESMREDLRKAGRGLIGDDIFFHWLTFTTQLLAHRSKKIITVSNASKNDICNTQNVSCDKVIVSYCGVDTIFSNQKAVLQKEIVPYFLYVGQQKKHKRLDWIIKRWQAAVTKLPANFKLKIVGEGLELEKEIKPLVLELNLAQNITFEGYVADSDLANLYREATALLLASSEEGFCLPAVEALACGCPVIACNIPVLREILGSNATLVGLNETEDYEQAIVAAVLRKERPDINFHQKYSWNSATEVIEAAFKVPL